MKKKIFRLWPIAASVALVACSESFDGPDLPSKDKSPMEALLGDFYASVHPGSRAEAPFEIIGVSKKTYRVENDSAIEVTGTRSLDGETFDVKVATLKFDNSLGYTVFSDDECINRVFFFTENGNIADTADIQPLKELIDCVPYIAIETMQYGFTRSESESRYYKDNFCPYNWNQNSPYNLYASVCGCDKPGYGGQTPIGCVTTAVAQAIATIGSFPGTYYGNRNLDFSKFRRQYESGASMDEKWQIAQFFHEIAHGCQVEFACSGSGTSVKAAYWYLKDLNFDCSYSTGAIDVDRVKTTLRLGIPHLIGGGDGDGGHMWLISGLREQPYGVDFWCNWGWGGHSDGWSAGNPYTYKDYTGASHSYPKNLKHIYINSK